MEVPVKKFVHIFTLLVLLFAVFACDMLPKTSYTISSSAGHGGVILPVGEITVAEHQAKTFHIHVSSAYVIDKIYVDGISLGPIPSYTFEDVTCNHTISALFMKEDQQTFTITAVAGPEGSITPEGVHTVSWKEDMTFTITADSGYAVSHVFVDGVDQGSLSTYTFNDIIANHEINALFVREDLQTFIITASAGSGGSISPEGQLTVPWNEDMTYTITADPEYIISHVTVDGVDQGPISSYTFNDVTTDHEINALFIREEL